MSINLGIHAVALLNICDYSVRSKSDHPQFIGALFGQVREREVIINHTFELILQDNTLDLGFLHEKSEQFTTVYTGQRLIGWYAVGSKSIEPWMAGVHEQVSQVVETPIFGLFNIPFESEMGVLPFKIFDSHMTELKVQMRVDEIEQIALQDILSAQGRKNSLHAQLANETRALLLFHRHLAQIQQELGKESDPRRQAELVSTVQQLCRPHDFGNAEQIRGAESEVISLLITGLIARGDSVLAALH